MRHINFTVTNEQNLPFLPELLNKFDFVSDIKIEKSPKTNLNENSNEDEKFEQHLSVLKEKYAHLLITFAT
jgi:hypothetical protein